MNEDHDPGRYDQPGTDQPGSVAQPGQIPLGKAPGPALGHPTPAPGAVMLAEPSRLNPSDERLWATIAHAAGPVAALVSVGTLGWLVPLLTYLFGKDRSLFVRQQSAEALNFQITLLIGYLAVIVIAALTLGVGAVLFPVVWVVAVVFGIIAAVAVNRGEAYRYPLNLRLVS